MYKALILADETRVSIKSRFYDSFIRDSFPSTSPMLKKKHARQQLMTSIYNVTGGVLLLLP